jgi:hypothetical protein
MGGARGTYKILTGKYYEKRSHLGYLSVAGRILLK